MPGLPGIKGTFWATTKVVTVGGVPGVVILITWSGGRCFNGGPRNWNCAETTVVQTRIPTTSMGQRPLRKIGVYENMKHSLVKYYSPNVPGPTSNAGATLAPFPSRNNSPSPLLLRQGARSP